jgi:multiple sugar transport system substrate-binding protein
MSTAKWPYSGDGRPRRARRHTRFIAIGAVAAAAALTAAGCSSSGGSSGGGGGSSSGGKTTITELDYFTTGGTNTAVIKYNKQYEAAHPGVTVKREVVPFANLITKVLQEASAGDLPNIVMLDDPNVPQVAATGQLLPLKGRPGFTTAGYVPGAISECSYQGVQYCFPIGTNTVGLIYNKKMFAAKHLSPPATWAQLQSDAKALTSGKVYGFAFDATADEQSTFQLEPWAWGAGGKLDNVNSAAWKNSLQVWVNLVKNHSSSKSVLQWGQSPDLVQQFTNKTAAMMENGPWAFPLLNAAGMKYNVDYGVVPIPSESAGQTPITPLGGETWNLGKSGSSTQQADAWDWIKGTQAPATMTYFSTDSYYLPTKTAVLNQYTKLSPQFQVFAKETETSQARTAEYGANYPKVSQAIWTAIQSAITGTSSVSSALTQAQSTISGVQKASKS